MQKATAFLSSQTLILLTFCGVGFLASFWLQVHFMAPSYVASAVVGLLGSFLPEWKLYDRKQVVASVYTGSFASMTSASFLESGLDVLILIVLTGLSFILLNRFYRGFGGKLGSIAFVSSLAFVLFKVVM